jgi:hypothetical protein
MLPVLLVGDSHLARVGGARLLRLDRAAGCRVVNGAVGGANVLDLEGQLRRFRPAGIVVISIGTNDAAPWKRVPLPAFRAGVAQTLGGLMGSRLIYVAPLGVDEVRLTGPGDRLNAEVRRYASVVIEMVSSVGGTVIDLADVLSGIRPDAFEADGVHLTTVAYGVVVQVLGEAIATIQRSAEVIDSLSTSTTATADVTGDYGRHD